MFPQRILCILVAIHLSFALPVPLENSSEERPEEPIPQFVWDLYQNYSSSDSQAQFNTIRTFENIPRACRENLEYQLTFDVSAIAEREEIYETRLRVYLSNSAAVNERDVLDATLSYADGTVISRILLDDASSQWIEFDNINLLGQPIQMIQEFQIQIDFYPYGHAHRNIYCNDDTFQLVTSANDLDTQPLLIVFSNDPDQSLSNLLQGLDIVGESSNKQTPPGDRPVRSTDTCNVQEAELSKDVLNSVYERYKVVSPDFIPLNICGGSCDNTITTTPIHADLLNIYISQDHIDKSEYQKCCTPLEYASFNIITISTTEPRVIESKLLSNASVTQCRCQYYRI